MNEVELQRELKIKGFYTGELDGRPGPLTKKAIDDYFHQKGLWIELKFPWERKLVAVKQSIMKDYGLEVGAIDGYVGPQTLYAFELYRSTVLNEEHRPTWRDEIDPSKTIKVPRNAYIWPRQKDVEKVYGSVGANQTTLEMPYELKIAWNLNQSVSKFSIHEKCADSAGRVFDRVLDHYGPERISELRLDYFGGCLNVRRMRGGTLWSMHSWGIALDFDPERNQLRWKSDKAAFADPVYDVWWRLWEEEGWTSLGRKRNFDWMHVQAARI